MTEPPRPAGEDPTPFNPYSANDPASGSTPPSYEPPSAPSYEPPPAAPQYEQPAAPQPPTYGAPGSGPGGYPPPPQAPGGFGQPGFGAGPVGYANDDEKTWALISHFGAILSFVVPVIALVTKGNESQTVRAHALESLNFRITWDAATVLAIILAVCSFGILFFLPIITIGIATVFSIIGGVKANEGTLYRYPMSVRLVK